MKIIAFWCISALSLLTAGHEAWAAACCSGSTLMPSLITTDSQTQVSARVSQSDVVGNSTSSGSSVFHRDGNTESSTFFTFTAAHALTPDWQIHLELPLNRRFRAIDANRSTGWGVSDVSMGASFEALPELTYNPFKPRVWVFADFTFPTGKSIYDSTAPLQADVTGRGAFAGTVGAYAMKTWNPLDAYALFEHRRYLPRNATINSRQANVVFGPTTAIELGAGYNYKDFRLGLGIGPSFDGATKVSGSSIATESRLLWNFSVQTSFLVQELWSLGATYVDQTIFGPTYNATLSRGVAFNATRRFE